MRLDWLPDVLSDAGCKVRVLDGWLGRGKELVSVEGLVWHHTVTPASVPDDQVARLLRDGHASLAGPLSQLGLQRDGTFVVVAGGKCNHNGYGEWGNQAIGIEAYNSGTGEPWPQSQLDAYDLGSAAILRRLGFGADRMKGHKETDPRRKIDPKGIDMDAARARVARLITDPHQEDDMPYTEEQLKAIVAEAVKPLAADLAEVKRQVTKSQDAKAKGGRTLRHIVATDLANGD